MDNSEYMRNGDYHPTRLQSQKDVLSYLFTTKTNANQENACGLISLAGSSPKVLSTLTSEHGRFLKNTHAIALEQDTHLITALQIGQLLLKHRPNKNQKQRLVVFVAHPIKESIEQLIKLSKKMKKNSVMVDVISFGECAVNQDKLEAFMAVFGDESKLCCIPQGETSLVDAVQQAGVFGNTSIGTNGEAFEFGVDPSLDPELALALRLSMEEEKTRGGVVESNNAVPVAMNVDQEETEEEMMQRALMMSMQQEEQEDETMELLKGVDGVDQDQVEKELGKK